MKYETDKLSMYFDGYRLESYKPAQFDLAMFDVEFKVWAKGTWDKICALREAGVRVVGPIGEYPNAYYICKGAARLGDRFGRLIIDRGERWRMTSYD